MKFKQSFQWICYSLSIFATLLSPISLIGIVDTGYHNGYRNFVAQFGIILALPILYWILKRIISYADVFEFIEDRFGYKSYIASKLLWTMYQLLRIGIILYIPAIMLKELTMIPASIWIVVLVLWAYVIARGGLPVVVKYDSIYSIILLASIITILIRMNSEGIVFSGLSSSRDSFSGTILVGASFQTLSSYLVSPDLQERFKQVGHSKLLRSILLNSFLGIIVTGILYLIGVSLKQAGYNFDDNVLLQYAKMKGLWMALPVTIGVLLAAQTTLSTGFEILVKQYSSFNSIPLILFISTGIAFCLEAIGGVSSYEFFVGYVGIFLTVISSLVILGLVFKKIHSFIWLIMCISLAFVRITFEMEMWMYGLVPFISGFIFVLFFNEYKNENG